VRLFGAGVGSNPELGEKEADDVGKGDDQGVADKASQENPEKSAENAAPRAGQGSADAQGEQQGDDDQSILHDDLQITVDTGFSIILPEDVVIVNM
jgi:hypothetical protein